MRRPSGCPSVLIAFLPGEPVKKGEEFNSFQTFDPEDVCLEIYCKRKS
ncbi:MAG: hypothetical protein HY067_12985 [Betaproteobacteria bacterium]|nr:hypothetical protein [Betaproteobacteria bacterium]